MRSVGYYFVVRFRPIYINSKSLALRYFAGLYVGDSQ